jgi:hypothetical protein
MPWPIHRSAEDLDTEPSQPLRFPIDVFDQEADLTARRVAAFATDQPWQFRPFEKRELSVTHLELDVAVALDPHREPDHVAVEPHRPPKRLDILDDVVHATHEIHRIGCRLHRHTDWSLGQIARWINPIVRAWLQYYGRFYRSKLYALCKRINTYLMRWAGKKYRRLHGFKKAHAWWKALGERYPRLFAQWEYARGFMAAGW